LGEEGLKPTNNRAERDLRPAVIVRKVRIARKTSAEREHFEAFTSLLQTLRKVNPRRLWHCRQGSSAASPPDLSPATRQWFLLYF
jgi:hypothetical protein